MGVVYIALLYFIDFKMYIFPYFSISGNEVFYNQWHDKIIVSSEMVVIAYLPVNWIINPAGMTRQLQPIDDSVNIPFKDHLWKRLPLLSYLLKPSVSYI